MAYKMWKKGRSSDDYKFIDSVIAEQYNIGGVDMWVYAYVGAKQLSTTSDETLPDSSGNTIDVSSIGDLIFGETPYRDYNLQAITFPVVYQIQEATPDLKLPGLFFNYNTMDITLHYNTMMQRMGRKIIPGDVIELPNLRDFDVIGADSGMNRFFVVQDSFRTSEGYSVTWQHHIFKLRVKPLTDSSEYSAITGSNDYPDNPDDPNNGNGNSTDGSSNSNYNNEMDIMNKIIMQGDNEVPYIHWTNEHLYNDRVGAQNLSSYYISGYEFPEDPAANMFFVKKTQPILYMKSDNEWSIVDVEYGVKYPSKPSDGDFFFKEDSTDVTGYSLYQYYSDTKKWLSCELPYSTEGIPDDVDDFYVLYQIDQLYQLQDDGKSWSRPPDSVNIEHFTSGSVIDSIYQPADSRNKIPPARGTVGEGTQFPENPSDGTYFYRTDYTPVTLWEYNDSTSSWVQFNYGGRLPWTGADNAKTSMVNSPDRVPLPDAVKPNTAYRINK